MGNDADEVEAIVDEVAKSRHKKQDVSVGMSCFLLACFGLGFSIGLVVLLGLMVRVFRAISGI